MLINTSLSANKDLTEAIDMSLNLSKPLALILLIFLTSACNVRFAADFESDTVGNLPPSSPPGPPADEIVLSDSQVTGDGVIVRITDNPSLVAPGRPHRFMSLIRDPDPGLSTITIFRTSTFATSTRPIFLIWEQVIDGGGSGQITVLRFPFGPAEESTSCRIFTGNDQIAADCFIGGDGPDVEDTVDGFDSHTQHTVLMRIDRPAGPLVLQVFQDGQATQELTLDHPDMSWPGEGERLNVQIEFTGQSDSAYRFNNFRITERDPG